MSKHNYCVFSNYGLGRAYLAFVNALPWFPVVGEVNGTKRPDKQKTDDWTTEPIEMLTGEYAAMQIPADWLNYVHASAEQRSELINQFGSDVRQLDYDDFVQTAEPI